MAAGINRVILIGNLTRDAEQSYTQSGFAILKFSIAVNSTRKQGDQWIDEANYFDITVLGKRGEAIASYMTKGQKVGVDGQLRQDRWEDKNDGRKRSKVYILADNIQFLSSRDSGSQGASSNNNWNNSAPAPSGNAPVQNAPQPQQGPPPTNFEDDIPF